MFFFLLCSSISTLRFFAFLSVVWSEEVCRCSLGGGEGEVRIFDQPQAHFETSYYRGINVNLRHNLIEVKPETKEAVFQHLDTQETVKQLPNKPVVKTTI